jgi:hypothetical protein
LSITPERQAFLSGQIGGQRITCLTPTDLKQSTLSQVVFFDFKKDSCAMAGVSSGSGLWFVFIGGTHQHNWNAGVVRDSLRHAAQQQTIEPTPTMRAHHDQVGLPGSGRFRDDLRDALT